MRGKIREYLPLPAPTQLRVVFSLPTTEGPGALLLAGWLPLVLLLGASGWPRAAHAVGVAGNLWCLPMFLVAGMLGEPAGEVTPRAVGDLLESVHVGGRTGGTFVSGTADYDDSVTPGRCRLTGGAGGELLSRAHGPRGPWGIRPGQGPGPAGGKGVAGMAMIVVLHRVRDYAAWRRVYDGAGASLQQAGGVTAQSVYRAKDDPNNVLVLHRFGTMAEAEAFTANPALREAMEQGGAEGAPRIEFFEEA